MEDRDATVEQLRAIVSKFIDEREWFQFHSPKNLSVSIVLEAAELMEKFQWCDNLDSFKEVEKNRDEVEQELADVVIYAFNFARVANIDIAKAIIKKMEINAQRYPVQKAKGVSTKHNKL